jgi:hypothetical protein
MTTSKAAIINLLQEFGPLTSSQIADAVDDAGIGPTLRALQAEGSIRRDMAGSWELDGAADVNFEDDADPGSMDGDAESALASAGWGTDEDYGYAEDVL